jgi:hypothetical protein
MPYMTMCANNDCPLKTTCYRYRAQPSEWQPYANFEYQTKENGEVECVYFIKFIDDEN